VTEERNGTWLETGDLTMSAHDQGKQIGQRNPHQQQATPRQVPNYQQRGQFNAGPRDGQKK
jgi:hypothetical protein